jgi:outer membrane lipoprotein-sorting protein
VKYGRTSKNGVLAHFGSHVDEPKEIEMKFSRISRAKTMSLLPVVAAAVILPATSAAAVAAPAQAAKPALEICGHGAAVTRPGSVILTCADNGEKAMDLHWLSWTSTQATATGLVTWRVCTAANCARSRKWDSTSAQITLSDPVAEHGAGVLFTRLQLNVTGRTPRGFMRDIAFDEAPVTPVKLTPIAPAHSQATNPAIHPAAIAPDAASGTLGYAEIEGFWTVAGGPTSSAGSYNDAQIAAAITGAESSFYPGIIQQGVDYCGTAPDEAGWGLWQITCGDSEPAYGTDFQLLDPWNNAEAAVAKCEADMSAGYSCFAPWSTYTSGAYESYLQDTAAVIPTSDPGEYVQDGSTPPGTPASPAADPGSTYGPLFPAAANFNVMFQSNQNDLYTYNPQSGGSSNINLGMDAGTSPAIASDGSGYDVVFQSNQNDLYTYDPSTGGSTNLNLGMDAGTSPSIASDGSGYEVAFQSNKNDLYLFDSSTGGSTNVNLGMAPGTSPAIVASPGGGYEVAFQANNGDLYTYDTDGNSHTDTGLGMDAGSSPAIASNGSGLDVMFQSNQNDLYTYDPSTGGSSNVNLGMDAGTSPAIASDGSGYDVMFQSNQNDLYTYDPSTGGSSNVNLGMDAGTSPSIAYSGGEYQVMFQSNQNDLYLYHPSTNGSFNVGLGMDAGSSPAIAGE